MRIGPGDLFWRSGFRNRIRYFFPGASRARASPALPESKSRWQRPAVRESQGGDSLAPQAVCQLMLLPSSPLPHAGVRVRLGCFQLGPLPGSAGLITNRTHTLFAKECLRMPLVALPASFSRKLPWFPSVLCPVSLPSTFDPAPPKEGYVIS